MIADSTILHLCTHAAHLISVKDIWRYLADSSDPATRTIRFVAVHYVSFIMGSGLVNFATTARQSRFNRHVIRFRARDHAHEHFWLNDNQWKRIEPHLPTDFRGVERADDRRVISGSCMC
jgi:hypothetical protein